jgi:hypothetical protein
LVHIDSESISAGLIAHSPFAVPGCWRRARYPALIAQIWRTDDETGSNADYLIHVFANSPSDLACPFRVPIAEVGPTRSPRQHGREARAAFAINYDGNPDQDGRPAGPALQVSRLQSWYTPRHSKDGICFKDLQSLYRARQLFMHCCLAV